MTVLLLVFLFQDPARKPPLEETISLARSRISALEEDLVRLGSKLDESEQADASLSGEIEQLELQRAMTAALIEKHELELEEATAALAVEQSREQELTEQAARQKDVLGRRLRMLYKRGPLGYAQLLLKQSQLSDLIGAYHYAKVMSQRDKQALEDLRETLVRLQSVRSELERIREEATRARASLVDRKKELDTLLDRRNRRLREIRRLSSQQQTLFQELELEKEELMLMTRRLTETDIDPMELRLPVSRYKGRLPWPVDGNILRRFGIYRDPEFKTERRINGLVMIVPKGREIKTVYSGRVIFADWFKSYGNLVIIDHGDKITSFYAHCDRLLVKTGDFVERDAVIALSGDTGSLEGPVLHLEIRNRTVPEDPMTWLASPR